MSPNKKDKSRSKAASWRSPSNALAFVEALRSGGQQLGAAVAMRDVSAYEQIEVDLCKSEHWFQAIFNQTLQFTSLLEPDGTVIEANQTVLDFGGFSAERVIGKLFWETPLWQHCVQAQAQVQQATARAAQGEVVCYETTLLGANATVPVDFSMKPVWDEVGNVILLIAEGRDITDLKQAYAEIDRLNATLEQRVAERTAQLEESNRSNGLLLERERQAKAEAEAAIAELERINCRNEDLLQRELQARTEAEEAVATVRSYAERLSLATDAANLGLWDLDCRTNVSIWNAQCQILLGYEPNEPNRTHQDWECRLSPEDRVRVKREKERAAAEQADFVTQYQILLPEGQMRWISAFGRFYYDDQKQPYRMIGIIADITDSKRAAQGLQESEERYRTLVESTSLIIWNTNSAGELVSDQPSWSGFTGQQLREFGGSGWLDAVHPADRAQTLESWSKAVERRAQYRIEHRLRRHDGEYRYMSVRAVPILDSNGDVREWIGVHNDITDRKQAEEALAESEEQFRATFEQAAIGIAHVGLEGQWLRVNRKLCQITGYSFAELSELTFQQITHPDDLEDNLQLLNQLLSGETETYSLEKRYIHKDGSTVWIELTVALMRGPAQSPNQSPNQSSDDALGAPKYFISVIEDISERKQGREALQERAHELANLNLQITQAAVLLEHRNQELDQFVHIVSHDLKAPLRAISNLSEWIEADLEGQLPPNSQKQLELLRTRAKRMESMINNLLLYARAGRQEVALETFNVADLLSEVIDSIDPPQSFSVQVELPMPTLTTKRTLLSQVFSNLIGNAVKHHKTSSGQLNIAWADSGTFYEFSVKDDGPGIAPSNHKRVFEIFQTLAAQNSSESSGLGLAIVKKIVEAEEGFIRIQSAVGQGTTFFFTWPKIDSLKKTIAAEQGEE